MDALYVLLGLIYTTTVFVIAYMDLIRRKAFTIDALWFYGGHVAMSIFLWLSVLFIVSAMSKAVVKGPPGPASDDKDPDDKEKQ